jgi:hypothetical protein
MTPQAIVTALLEDDSLDSFEGNPGDWDLNDPEQHRAWKLRFFPPKSPQEARQAGVDWYIKDFRKWRIAPQTSTPNVADFRTSAGMATGRNRRRKSYGYRDTYSMRERGWPTAIRRPDGTLKKKRPVEAPTPTPNFQI